MKMKRLLYKIFMAQKVSQAHKDEDEFLTDLNRLRSKWTMRAQTDYACAIKAVVSEFTNPEHETADYQQPAQRAINNIVG